MYLEYLETKALPKADLLTGQKLLWISEFFNDRTLTKLVIDEMVIPQLTKETVLLFLQDSYNNKKSGDFSESWQKLFNASLEEAAKHVDYIIGKSWQALSSLDGDLMGQVLRYSMSTIISHKSTRLLLEKFSKLHSVST